MTLPAGLLGAWARASITFGDDEPVEPHVVRYLQASPWYADLRVPISGDAAEALSFAGTCTWDEPWAEWSHELDLDPSSGPDRGEIVWRDDGGMDERGAWTTPDGEVPYLEVWQPLPVGEGGVVALRCESPPARLLQVGEHAIVICDDRADGGQYRARYDRRVAGRWRPELSLGSAAELPHPPDDVPEPGGRLELGGITWTVDQRSGG